MERLVFEMAKIVVAIGWYGWTVYREWKRRRK